MCRMNLTQNGMLYSASWLIITRCGRLTIYNIVKTIAVCFETTRLHDQAIFNRDEVSLFSILNYTEKCVVYYMFCFECKKIKMQSE